MPPNILYLDDNPLHAELLAEFLHDHAPELQVISCQSPREFFDLTEQSNYDLFLIDYQLPGTNGFEVAKNLRSRGRMAPVVFLSGVADEAIISDCINQFDADFVLKTRTAFATLPRLLTRRIARSNPCNKKENDHDPQR